MPCPGRTALCALSIALASLGPPIAAQRSQAAVKMAAFATARPEGLDLDAFGAADPAFLYEGRFDFAKPDAPLMAWQASRVRVDFEGDSLAIKLDGSGQAFLDAEIDGATFFMDVRGGGKSYYYKGELGPGRHSLVLYKRTEASIGSVRFRGLEIEKGMTVRRPIVEYRSRVLFLGDSATAGSCDEDGEVDQWSDYSTHNAARSYAALVAKELGADLQNVSVSGMGMVEGWNGFCAAPQIWDRLTADPKGPRADLRSWVPDIALINLGENDGSYTAAKGRPFPEDFAKTYVEYLGAIKAAWPKAHIVILRGGMFNGSSNQALIAAIEEVARRLEGDPLVHYFAFEHFSAMHPRVGDHRILADELLAFLRTQDSLAAFLPR